MRCTPIVLDYFVTDGNTRGTGSVIETLAVAPAELVEDVARVRGVAPELVQPALVALQYTCSETRPLVLKFPSDDPIFKSQCPNFCNIRNSLHGELTVRNSILVIAVKY